MIRKVIIVMLLLAAIPPWMLGVARFWVALRCHVFGASAVSMERYTHQYRLPRNHAALWSQGGRLGLQVTYIDKDKPTGRGRSWRFAGLEIQTSGRYLGEHTTVASVPFFVPIILLLVYPVIVFIRGPLRRWRRHIRGQCDQCGYNLTGNVSGVCPECGARVDAQ